MAIIYTILNDPAVNGQHEYLNINSSTYLIQRKKNTFLCLEQTNKLPTQDWLNEYQCTCRGESIFSGINYMYMGVLTLQFSELVLV